MARRKSLTEAQKQARKRERNITRAYKRQRERIITTIAEQKALGAIYPDTFKLPAIPKKITEASVRRLKKITNISLINKANYIRPETGEAVRGTRGRRIALKPLIDNPSISTRKAQDAVTPQEHIEEIRKRQEQEARAKEEYESEYESEATEWEQEETDDERIRRRFQESLDRQDAEAEEEKRKEQERQDYIDHLKRLHDKDMEQRRRESEGYSSEPVSETSNVLGWLEDKLKEWEPESVWSKDLATRKENQVESLKTRLDSAIRRDGRDATARKLQSNASRVMELINDIMFGYSSDRGQFYSALNRASGELVDLGNIFDEQMSASDRYALSEQMEDDEYEEYEE